MTTTEKKDLLRKLIAHYQSVIERVRNTPYLQDARKIIKDTETHLGVCYCSLSVFKVEVYKSDWVVRNQTNGDHWAPKPYHADNIVQIIERLQKRVDIMEQELQREEL